MAINFNDEDCQSITSENIFGIHDKPPSIILFENEEIWHVWVDNEKEKEITHTALLTIA